MNTTVLNQSPKSLRPPVIGAAAKISHQPGPKANPEIMRNGIMKTPIKVLLVDDHPIVRKGVASCLSRQASLEVVGEAADGREALAKARETSPDVVLMDMDMPQMDGLALTQMMRKELPRVKILILSMHRHSDAVMRILQCGAMGYVLKDAAPEELVAAIQAVHGGEAYYSPDIARIALNQFVRGPGEGPYLQNLTNREREVLVCIANGMSNKEIAMRLGVGVRTVETHRERIMRKLDIHSVAGLTRFAIANGLISLTDKPSA